MFLLQSLSVDQKSNVPITTYGIQVGVLERVRKVFVKDEFWGKTEIVLEDNSDFGYDPKKKGEYVLLPYVNSFEVEELEDCFKKFYFNVGKHSTIVEGFIVFIKSSSMEIETNGEKLFGKTSNEIVVLLRNNQYVEFDGNHFQNLGGRMWNSCI